MNKIKVVTLCGSIKFWNKMQEINEKLALENEYVVIGLTPCVTNRIFTEHDKKLLGELHRAKIDLSDAIFVVNVDSYIRESTRGEIVYAKKFVIWELNMPETLVNFK